MWLPAFDLSKQAPRTNEQQPIFELMLRSRPSTRCASRVRLARLFAARICPASAVQWYAHKGTTVWLVTAGKDRVKGLGYWDKGWCVTPWWGWHAGRCHLEPFVRWRAGRHSNTRWR